MPYRAKALDGRWLYPVDAKEVPAITYTSTPWQNGVEVVRSDRAGYANLQHYLLVADGVTVAILERSLGAPYIGFSLAKERAPQALLAALPEYVANDERTEKFGPFGQDDDGDWLAEHWYNHVRGEEKFEHVSTLR